MTTLYIKTHNVTGLKYFGKTIKKNVHKYSGSGKYWKNHLNKHGYDITTEILAQFDETDFIERKLLEGYSFMFSYENNIVESKEWANLKYEDGIGGGIGYTHSKETISKILNTKSKIGEDGLTIFERSIMKTKETKSTLEWKENSEPERIKKFRESVFQTDEITNKKKSTLMAEKAAEKMSIPQENGKTIREEATENMVRTKNIIGEDGLTTYERTGLKTSKRLSNPETNTFIGSFWVNNGVESLKLSKNSVIPQGYYPGRVPFGTIWITNSSIEMKILKNEDIPDGFKKGRMKSRCEVCGKIAINHVIKRYHINKSCTGEQN